MVFAQQAVVGEIGLQLLVGVVAVSALRPSLLALSLHAGVGGLVEAARGGILLIRGVDRGLQSLDKFELGFQITQETVAFVVVGAVAVQFDRVFGIRSIQLCIGAVGIVDREGGLQVGHALKDAAVNGMPPVEVGIDALVQPQASLPGSLIGCQRTCQPVHVITLDDALAVSIGSRGTITMPTPAARKKDVVGMGNCRALQFLLPVGACSIVESIGHVVVAHIAAPLVGRKQVHVFGSRGKGHVAIILHGVLLLFAPVAVGGHDDDTVGPATTIDSSGRGVFQNVHADNLGGLHRVEINTRNAVDDHQRAVAGRERRAATQAQARPSFGSTTALHYRQAGHLALQQLLGAGDDTLAHVFRVDGGDGSGEIALAHGAVTDTDNHGLIQSLGILDHCDVKI